MTLKEKISALEQLKYLRDEVEMLSQRIAELEQAAAGGTARITGMPRGTARWDRTGDFAAKIVEVSEKLEARRLRCMELLGWIYDFIDGVEDSRMRQILTYRYIDAESWQSIAFRIGEVDEQVPRRWHNKFLENAKFDENDERKVL